MRLVIALGGNAILKRGERGTFSSQLANLRRTSGFLAEIAREHEIVITHGNGPQVGALLIQQEQAKGLVPPMPLDACDAMTQGLLGYAIQTEMDKVMREKGMDKRTVSVLTRMVVDKNDPAFENPTKPVGPFYPSPKGLPKEWVVKEDAGRGYRRVVPSPMPIRSLESKAILALLDRGYIVVCGGGGGIPVLEDLTGVEAVIDKDLASYVIAREIGADGLIILTDVEYAYLNFRKPNQKPIREITLEKMKSYLSEGHFSEGSMKPKILAAIKFVESGGKFSIITRLDKVLDALNRKTGTIITQG